MNLGEKVMLLVQLSEDANIQDAHALRRMARRIVTEAFNLPILERKPKPEPDGLFYSPRNQKSMIRLTERESDIGKTNGKIQAVKEYKTRTGYSIIESKRVVEDYFDKYGLSFGDYKPL